MPSNSRKESYPIIKRWCVFFSFYSTFKYWILFLCYLRWVCKEMDPSETMLCISLSTIRRVSPFIWALECWISLSSDMSILLWCFEVVISLYHHSRLDTRFQYDDSHLTFLLFCIPVVFRFIPCSSSSSEALFLPTHEYYTIDQVITTLHIPLTPLSIVDSFMTP